MNSIIIYHSITGNTKKIAKAIHTGMKTVSQVGELCDIARLRDVDSKSLERYDLIGLGSPVIGGRELANATNFIENDMKGVDGKHGFAFCTHGALPGNYLARVIPAMKQRGLTVVGWNNWFCSVYHPGVPKPYFTDGHPDDIDLKEAEEFGKQLIECSLRIYSGEIEQIPLFPTGREYDKIYFPMRAQDTRMNKKMEEDARELRRKFENVRSAPFKVNSKKCHYPKCTFCIDNCPNNSIDFSVSPPIFNMTCQKCWLCEMACPQGAIEFDFEPYHEIHWQMVPYLEKALEVFESQGRFRRLVSKDDIGWESPFWQFKKPRYKIA